MHQTDNKSFVIVYLNKVDFSPSQSFFSKKKKGIVEEKARTRHTVSLIYQIWTLFYKRTHDQIDK